MHGVVYPRTRLAQNGVELRPVGCGPFDAVALDEVDGKSK